MLNGFPAEFLWGVATSAFQVEGAVSEDGRAPSIWDTFCHTSDRIADRSNADVACDHYHRWRDDVVLLAWLGVNAYRFSIAWPRVIPSGRGAVNAKGLDFYDRLVDELLAARISPLVTLYHWDLPQALHERGGWVARDTALAFAEYAHQVAVRLGDRVPRFVTHNEPWCTAFLGYQLGVFAPGERDLARALRAAHNVLLSHGLAVDALRAAAPHAKVGIAPNFAAPYPASDDPRDVRAAARYDGYFNRWFLDPLSGRDYPADTWECFGADVPDIDPSDMEVIARPIDFLGVNYYNPQCIADDPGGAPPRVKELPDPALPRTADRPIDASRLFGLLTRLRREYPFREYLVTENGAAFADEPDGAGRVQDHARVDFLERHFREARRALEAGVPLTGYFVWSLLDNFEWSEGYRLRYGLVHVDFETQARTPKASAHWLREQLARRGRADSSPAPG